MLCASLAVWLGAGAAPAQAFEVGVQDDPVFLYGTSYPRERAFAQARQMGAAYVRMNVIWSDWVRAGPIYYENAVNRARANGLQVHFTLMVTPSYYGKRADFRLSYYKPSPARFASFAREVALRFRGRVRRYSIGNEPNLYLFLQPQRQAPAIYRSLFRAGYQAIKSVDRGAQVLFGEIFSGATVRMPKGQPPLTFLSRAAARGLVADGLAYHPIQYNLSPFVANRRIVGLSSIRAIKNTLRTLARRRLLRTPRGGVLPIHFTEFGYQISGSWPVRPESRRASWVVSSFSLAKRAGVRSMVYFHLVRNYGRTWDSGIVNGNGTATPVFGALLRARRSLVGR